MAENRASRCSFPRRVFFVQPVSACSEDCEKSVEAQPGRFRKSTDRASSFFQTTVLICMDLCFFCGGALPGACSFWSKLWLITEQPPAGREAREAAGKFQPHAADGMPLFFGDLAAREGRAPAPSGKRRRRARGKPRNAKSPPGSAPCGLSCAFLNGGGGYRTYSVTC